jgi:chromate reductase, NAD(P)H dehydrogenase (quinone)
MLVVGLSGSLRRNSHNRRLLAAAARALPPEVVYEEWRGLASVPPYDADLDVGPAPAAVYELRAALGGADAVLIATPEYNHSLPGQLKNALDWASRPFPDNALHGTPAAVIGASTSIFGGVWAQAEVRKTLGAIGARVIDEELAVAQAHEAFEADGSLRDPELQAGLDHILAQLVAAARAPRGRFRRSHSPSTRRAIKASSAAI